MNNTLILIIIAIITICNGFVTPILKKLQAKHPKLFDIGGGKVGNLKGVPNITICDQVNSNPDLQWVGYSLNPPDIKPDEQITCIGNATLSKNVTGGNVNANIQIGNLNILNEDFDLCEMVPYVGLECPVAAGPINIDEVETLPYVPYSPSSVFNITINITDQDSDPVTCVNIITTID